MKIHIDGRLKLYNRSSVTNLHQDFGHMYMMQGASNHILICAQIDMVTTDCTKGKRTRKMQKGSKNKSSKVKLKEGKTE